MPRRHRQNGESLRRRAAMHSSLRIHRQDEIEEAGGPQGTVGPPTSSSPPNVQAQLRPVTPPTTTEALACDAKLYQTSIRVRYRTSTAALCWAAERASNAQHEPGLGRSTRPHCHCESLGREPCRADRTRGCQAVHSCAYSRARCTRGTRTRPPRISENTASTSRMPRRH